MFTAKKVNLHLYHATLLVVYCSSYLHKTKYFDDSLIHMTYFRACLHGGGVPQIGEVTRLGGVARLSI